MFSCKKVTRLNSERLDRPLSIGERIFAAIHMLYCSTCRQVMRQLSFLHRAMSAYRGESELPPAEAPRQNPKNR